MLTNHASSRAGILACQARGAQAFVLTDARAATLHTLRALLVVGAPAALGLRIRGLWDDHLFRGLGSIPTLGGSRGWRYWCLARCLQSHLLPAVEGLVIVSRLRLPLVVAAVLKVQV
eukprot:2359738-Rhodomonas_salina.1